MAESKHHPLDDKSENSIMNLSVLLVYENNSLPPYIYNEEVDGVNKIVGFLPDVINIICSSEYISCLFQNASVEDGLNFTSNPSWDVFVGDFVMGEFCFDERDDNVPDQSLVSCSVVFGHQRQLILSGVRQENMAPMSASLLSMDFDMSILLIWSWLMVSMTVYLIGKRYQHKYRSISILDSLWNIMGCVFCEPIRKADFWIPARYVYTSWMAAAFVVTTVFSGNLKSSLTLSVPNKIDTLQDILDRPQIRPVVGRARVIEGYFQNSTEGSTYWKVWKQIERHNGSVSIPFPDEVMTEVAEGASVIIAFEDQLITSVNSYCSKHNDHRLSFYISPKEVDISRSVVYLKRGLNRDLWQEITKGLRHLSQSSISDRYLQSRLYSSKRCVVQPEFGGSQMNPIALEGIACTFHLLVIGHLFSCLVLLLECTFKFLTSHIRTWQGDRMLWKRDHVSKKHSK